MKRVAKLVIVFCLFSVVRSVRAADVQVTSVPPVKMLLITILKDFDLQVGLMRRQLEMSYEYVESDKNRAELKKYRRPYANKKQIKNCWSVFIAKKRNALALLWALAESGDDSIASLAAHLHKIVEYMPERDMALSLMLLKDQHEALNKALGKK